MARKKTYASVMDDMSKKLRSYQNRLQKAEQQGDAVGKQDYTRRIERIQAGMETLFNTQEASKMPMAAYGGKFMPKYAYGAKHMPKYGPGGLTQESFGMYKYLNSLLPQERSAEDNQRLAQLQAEVDAAMQMGWQEDFGFNPDGSMAGRPMPTAEAVTAAPPAEPYTGPSITPQEALDRIGGTGPSFQPAGRTAAQVVQDTIEGARDGADALRDSVNTSLGRNSSPATTPSAPTPPPEMAGPGQPGNRFYPGENLGTAVYTPTFAGMELMGDPLASQPAASPAPTPAPAPAPAPPSAPAEPMVETAAPAAAPASMQARSLATPTMNAPTLQGTATANPGAVDPKGKAITAPTKSAEESASGASTPPDFFNQLMGGDQNKVAQYAQFVPDLFAAYQMNKLDRPVNMPTQTMARMNTDVNYNPVYAQARQQMASEDEFLDRNISNPVVRAALKRSARNQNQAQMGQMMTNEINQEMNLQNQYAQNIANNQNANKAIYAQNQQQQIDFDNNRRAANARMLQQAGMKMGQIYGENQNRDLQLRSLGLSALQYDGDLMERMATNYNNLFGGGS